LRSVDHAGSTQLATRILLLLCNTGDAADRLGSITKQRSAMARFILAARGRSEVAPGLDLVVECPSD